MLDSNAAKATPKISLDEKLMIGKKLVEVLKKCCSGREGLYTMSKSLISFPTSIIKNKFRSLLHLSEKICRSEQIKRMFDQIAASLFILCFLPIFALIGLALVIQGRPLLIRHQRIGRDGKLFPCFKFRTMVVNSDKVLQHHLMSDPMAREEWNNSQKLKNDPRVTSLGRVLRKSSLDELPQLLNVLRGEMSIVGPRPIVPAEMVHYGVHIDKYQAVRPGLTGAWQVSGRSDVSYSQRVSLDCKYVESRNIQRDIAIMLMTIPAVLKTKGSY